MTRVGDCPTEDCTASYVPAVLQKNGHECPSCEATVLACPSCASFYPPDAVTDRRCPECNDVVARCPICRTLVRIGEVHDRGECPSCGRPRLDLGQAWRQVEQETGVRP